MAMIKCPECGKDVSDKAVSCPSCGTPIKAPESKLIVYGLQQRFLIGGTMKLFIDGEYVGSVKKFDRAEFPITKDCVLTAKCGVNLSKGECKIKAGEITKVQIIFRKGTTGGFYMQKVDAVTNGIIG